MLCRVLEIQWYLKALTSSRRRDHKRQRNKKIKHKWIFVRKKQARL